MVNDGYVVGVDGGASKTVALVGNSLGKILGRGESGSSNYHNIGIAKASEAVRSATREARGQAGLREKPEIAVVALAAVDSAADRRVSNQFIQSLKIAKKSFVVHDSIAALYAATQGKPGIIVISGTGCVAAGISAGGEYVRVGGWGFLIDDEGSSFDTGRKALTKAFRAVDGRGQDTKLTSALKRKFRVKTPEEILNVIYANGVNVEEIAALASLVSKTARYDKVCRQILNEAGRALAELVCTVARRLNMSRDPFQVKTVGGSFKAGSYLLQPFVTGIKRDCPQARIARLRIEPVRGALSLAASELRSRNSQTSPLKTYRFLNKVC
jgi:N-acetylglucosamine kinase-like BadF-type ATPase